MTIMQPLRIAVVTWFYDDQPGFQDFRYRIEALGRQHQVTLVLRDARFIEQFQAPGLHPVVLPRAGAGTRDLLIYLAQVCRRLQQDKHDITVLLGAQLALATPWLAPSPVALYWNEHPTHTYQGGRWGALSRWLCALLVKSAFKAARHAAVVMPIGEAHHKDLVAHDVPAGRLRLIPMGVEDRFAAVPAQRRPRPAGAPLHIIYTGTVARERGRDVMLDGLALALQRGASCRLTLVGASPAEMEHCHTRAAALGISDALAVIGRVPGEQIPALLADADAGVCIWEDRIWWRFNPPTKLFEYLAAGLPVLASRIRTHTAYLDHGVNGLVFDYDAAAFADALCECHARRGQWPAMAAAAALSGRSYLWHSIEPRFVETITQCHTPLTTKESP